MHLSAFLWLLIKDSYYQGKSFVSLFSDNVFSYELIDDQQYFYVTTEAGSSNTGVAVLRVKKVTFYLN